MVAKTNLDGSPHAPEEGRPRVVVCGACDDVKFVYRRLDSLFRKIEKKCPIVCLQGRAAGLDKVVNQWAFGAGHLRKIFHPKDHKEESRQRAVRDMIEYATRRRPAFVVVFGDDDRVERPAIDADMKIHRIEVKR